MKNKSRLFTVFLILWLILSVMPLSISANSPEPSPFYTFHLSNLPEETEYVDLLIFLPETDEMYTELNKENIPKSFSGNAQILSYCENNYRSYTFHYQEALAAIRLQKDDTVRFFTDGSTWYDDVHIRFKHGAEIDDRGDVYLAMLDTEGNILMISKPLCLTDVDRFSYRLGDFYYDAQTHEFEIETDGHNELDPPDHYISSSIYGILLTCLLEWLISFLFDLKGYRGLIIITNVVSQILMRIAYAMLYLYSDWGYDAITLVLEVMIYTGEFLFYYWRMTNTSWRKCLGYTVLANSVSFILGHITNLLFFFGMLIMI